MPIFTVPDPSRCMAQPEDCGPGNLGIRRGWRLGFKNDDDFSKTNGSSRPLRAARVFAGRSVVCSRASDGGPAGHGRGFRHGGGDHADCPGRPNREAQSAGTAGEYFYGAGHAADRVYADRQHSRRHLRAGFQQLVGYRSGRAGRHGRRYSVQPRAYGLPGEHQSQRGRVHQAARPGWNAGNCGRHLHGAGQFSTADPNSGLAQPGRHDQSESETDRSHDPVHPARKPAAAHLHGERADLGVSLRANRMNQEMTKKESGFTLVELMVSFFIGLIVLSATVKLFKSGVDASVLVSQRAELQQSSRAAINLTTKDISVGGAGLATGCIQLPSGGAATTSRYACDQAGTCYVPTHLYPTGNYMYGIIPGPNNGVQNGVLIPATGQSADSITVAYLDYAFPLSQYTCVVSSASTITMTAPVPAPNPPLPAINAAGVGLQAGDLVMVVGGNIATTVAEVTTVTNAVITFAAADPLNLNNTAGDPVIGNLAYIFNRSVAP